MSSYQLDPETKVLGSQTASGCSDESLHDVLEKPNCPIVVPTACRRLRETIQPRKSCLYQVGCKIQGKVCLYPVAFRSVGGLRSVFEIHAVLRTFSSA